MCGGGGDKNRKKNRGLRDHSSFVSIGAFSRTRGASPGGVGDTGVPSIKIPCTEACHTDGRSLHKVVD